MSYCRLPCVSFKWLHGPPVLSFQHACIQPVRGVNMVNSNESVDAHASRCFTGGCRSAHFLHVSTGRSRIITFKQPHLKKKKHLYPDSLNITSLASCCVLDTSHRHHLFLTHTQMNAMRSCCNSYLCSEDIKSFVTAGPQTSDHCTYCENIYLTGRHRHKWLCGGIMSPSAVQAGLCK